MRSIFIYLKIFPGLFLSVDTFQLEKLSTTASVQKVQSFATSAASHGRHGLNHE